MTREPLVVGLDAGTSGTTALVLDARGVVRGSASVPLRAAYPSPGLVEQDLAEIADGARRALSEALADAGARPQQVAALGIANQRETACAWDADLVPLAPALVWQDRRTTERCEALRAAGHEPRVRELTGLPFDPYFSATKLAWLCERVPAVARARDAGRLRLGTVDTWLVATLARGAPHLTDATNASRTQLMPLAAPRFDDGLCELFGVPPEALPAIVPSCGVAAHSDPSSAAGIDAPIAGIAGDQQAALFGQACHAHGGAKNTYGTGSFLLVHTGGEPRATRDGLTTVALLDRDGLHYAVEGSVFVSGAALQWLRDGLGTIASTAEVDDLARAAAPDSGVVVVPAFAGLGAPHWDPRARAAILGLTAGAGRAEVVRATLEAMALQVCDVLDALCGEDRPAVLRADGGGARSDVLLQLQADLGGIAVERPTVVETTAQGAAWLAGIGAGIWEGPEEVAAFRAVDARFEPALGDDQRETRRATWRAAVAAVRSFAAG